MNFIKCPDESVKHAILIFCQPTKMLHHLSRQALIILDELKTMTSGYLYVFPGRLEKVKPISDMSLNVLIRRVGYGGRATGHGFRHTMSTILHEQGFNSVWIELQLAHVDKNSIRGTYNHAQYLDGRREMMQWYADYIDQLISSSIGNSY